MKECNEKHLYFYHLVNTNKRHARKPLQNQHLLYINEAALAAHFENSTCCCTLKKAKRRTVSLKGETPYRLTPYRETPYRALTKGAEGGPWQVPRATLTSGAAPDAGTGESRGEEVEVRAGPTLARLPDLRRFATASLGQVLLFRQITQIIPGTLQRNAAQGRHRRTPVVKAHVRPAATSLARLRGELLLQRLDDGPVGEGSGQAQLQPHEEAEGLGADVGSADLGKGTVEQGEPALVQLVADEGLQPRAPHGHAAADGPLGHLGDQHRVSGRRQTLVKHGLFLGWCKADGLRSGPGRRRGAVAKRKHLKSITTSTLDVV